jgi:hypothetical protein
VSCFNGTQRSSIAAGGVIAFCLLVTAAGFYFLLMFTNNVWLYSSSWDKSTKVFLQMRLKWSAPLAAILLLAAWALSAYCFINLSVVHDLPLKILTK